MSTQTQAELVPNLGDVMIQNLQHDRQLWEQSRALLPRIAALETKRPEPDADAGWIGDLATMVNDATEDGKLLQLLQTEGPEITVQGEGGRYEVDLRYLNYEVSRRLESIRTGNVYQYPELPAASVAVHKFGVSQIPVITAGGRSVELTPRKVDLPSRSPALFSGRIRALHTAPEVGGRLVLARRYGATVLTHLLDPKTGDPRIKIHATHDARR